MEEALVIHYLDTPRSEIIVYLIARDGDECAYCDIPFDDDPDSKWFRTIDHYHSVDWCKRQGWSSDEIHSADNLVLAHKSCNSAKSNRAWREDGTLEPRGRSRAPKVARPPICDTCESGRILLAGETCPDCGSGPQPATAPKYLQRRPKDCDHDVYHCFMCFVGHIPRRSALSKILNG